VHVFLQNDPSGEKTREERMLTYKDSVGAAMTTVSLRAGYVTTRFFEGGHDVACGSGGHYCPVIGTDAGQSGERGVSELVWRSASIHVESQPAHIHES